MSWENVHDFDITMFQLWWKYLANLWLFFCNEISYILNLCKQDRTFVEGWSFLVEIETKCVLNWKKNTHFKRKYALCFSWCVLRAEGGGMIWKKKTIHVQKFSQVHITWFSHKIQGKAILPDGSVRDLGGWALVPVGPAVSKGYNPAEV